MGRYNFNSKLDSLNERIKQLEEQNSQLIAALKSQESKKEVKKRDLMRYLDTEKIKSLFSVDVDSFTGEVISSEKRIASNFTNLYRNVLRSICPMGKNSEGPGSPFFLSQPTLKELSDDQFEIFKSSMEKILDIVYDAHTEFTRLLFKS